MEQPNPIQVAFGIIRVLVQVRRPSPSGAATVDHSMFAPVLGALATGGLPAAASRSEELGDYVAKLETIDPDTLTKEEALAYWINLYNAGAVQLAARTYLSGAGSVLRTPGGFSEPMVTVADEVLSLDAIEHAKIRRFKDARIHGALVCGSLSCPTLRSTPFSGDDISAQLDDQMCGFLAAGGAVAADKNDTVSLSRVLLWYGSDFARPHRMPTFIPATKKNTLEVVRQWLPDELQSRTRVEFQDYDWALGCAVR